MDSQREFADRVNFTASEYALGRQRCRKWVSLITQQLRLRHIYQIYAYNLATDNEKAKFYFTLHNTPMSAPFYTSETVEGKHPKWNELLFTNMAIDTSVSSMVIRIWKTSKMGDEILLTWGVNFSGLVYLGNKIADLRPKHFERNAVIFFMQGAYFTSQHCLRMNLERPFGESLNLIETSDNRHVLYRRIAVKERKGEITDSYTVEKLRKLQELQRQIKNRKIDVENVKGKIRKLSEPEPRRDVYNPSISSYNNNIRFAPQLLTMNCLNKMLHEKPTKAQREIMDKVSKRIECCRFRLRLLNEERDQMSVNLRKLKLVESQLAERNEETNSNLMSLYHALSKDASYWTEYRHDLLRRKEHLLIVSEQLRLRQAELLKELLFIYPIDKLPNENKYTMLGIHLPDSEQLLDYNDPGVSVVLGYVCHILSMCSIFLQIPLRHPVRHFGSRSVIYDQVYPDIPDKEREFPLYTKGRDRAHFSYAVFLLNKNISQLRWYLHRKGTVDLKETLKHVRNLLLGEEIDHRQVLSHLQKRGRHLKQESVSISFDKLVSPSSISSLSSTNFNDSTLDKSSSLGKSPKKRSGKLKSVPKQRGSNEVLAVPEAYLNRQISKDLFQKCASGTHKFEEKETEIHVGQGIEIVHDLERSDSVEEGMDPLDPSTNMDSLVTKSIDIINKDQLKPNESNRIASCDRESELFERLQIKEDVSIVASNELVFSREVLSLQSSPLTERTDRLLLSTNQSFNLVKHRPTD